VILLLDGSGSVTEEGFAMEKEFAKLFVSAFKGNDVRVSLILFSGPRTWRGVFHCMSAATLTEQEKIDVCGITLAQHFTSDMNATEGVIDGLVFPKGSTLTSMALSTAIGETKLSRPELGEDELLVVLVTDGRPLSTWAAEQQAKKLKDTGARLLVVPVKGKGLTETQIESMKKMATDPESVLETDFHHLSDIPTIDELLTDVCKVVEEDERCSAR